MILEIDHNYIRVSQFLEIVVVGFLPSCSYNFGWWEITANIFIVPSVSVHQTIYVYEISSLPFIAFSVSKISAYKM